MNGKNSNAGDKKAREFIFTDREFKRVKELVMHHSGINLSDAKRDMVYSRLVRRVRALQMDSFKAYCDLIEDGSGDETVNFVNALTTNLTSFFRENHHFDYLKGTILPEVLSAQKGRSRLRIWSAGCSTGEEPYSIAMTVRDSPYISESCDTRILATDLDTNVIRTGKQGVYDAERVKGIPINYKKKWLLRGTGHADGMVRVKNELKNIISFKQLNLLGDWPFKGPFDVIFCRNVVIYFNKDTQRILFDRFAEVLSDDGYLIIGHSETLFKVTDRFKLIGQTIYKKNV